MGKHIDGTAIVAGLAHGRPWWKLGARDVAPWARSLHPSATRDRVSCIEWAGDEWNGASDIQVRDHVVPGADVMLLIEELRRLLSQTQIDCIALPDAGSVRQNLTGIGPRQALTFDFDFGDFVLPLCIEERHFGHPPYDSMTAVAVRMIEILFTAVRDRRRIAKRELRLRLALEETVARIGNGAAPLWLRMDSFLIDNDPRNLATSPYLMLLLRLDSCLEWSPLGDERIHTVKQIRAYHGFEAPRHRRRAQVLNEQTATGSRGSISEIALSLIEEQGLEPSDVFEQVHSATLAGERWSVQFVRNGQAEVLYFEDGAVHASIRFDGGHYNAGRLTLWGDYPETLATAAKGRPLASFVDHPAFLATGVKVSSASSTSEAMDLKHKIRLIPLEAALRKFAQAA
jgi:hypothetical protein